MRIIKFSNNQKLTSNIEELKGKPEFNKAQKGKWYQFQRFYVVKSLKSEAYGLVALNFFERLARNICHVNYLKKRFKEGSVTVISTKSLKTPTVQKVETIQPQIKPSKIVPAKNLTSAVIPLEKTGGCENAGATCFVATPFQIIKQIPIVAEHLKTEYHLKQKSGESDQKFVIRKQIKDSLASLVLKSMQGETITKKEMAGLQELLSNYAPAITSQPGMGGMEDSALLQFFEILEIDCDGEVIFDNQNNDFHLNKLKQPTDAPVFLLRQMFKGSEISKNTLLTDPLPFLKMPSTQSPELNTYQLVGATIGFPGHAIACVKDIHDHDPNAWVSFNDAVVKKEKFKDLYQEFTTALIYTRIS